MARYTPPASASTTPQRPGLCLDGSWGVGPRSPSRNIARLYGRDAVQEPELDVAGPSRSGVAQGLYADGVEFSGWVLLAFAVAQYPSGMTAVFELCQQFEIVAAVVTLVAVAVIRFQMGRDRPLRDECLSDELVHRARFLLPQAVQRDDLVAVSVGRLTQLPFASARLFGQREHASPVRHPITVFMPDDVAPPLDVLHRSRMPLPNVKAKAVCSGT